MSYACDVFISYRREKNWTPWTHDHLKDLLESYLQQDLERPVKVFVDRELEPGRDWVREIAEKLARSRVLVAVFSADYFTSPWCLHELDLMVERWLAAGRASPGTIVP